MRPKQLQSLCARPVLGDACPRPAFTLVELIVSIGVLLLLITMAGSVFSLTLRSTGQAKGLTDISQRLRVFEQVLTGDLAAMPREDTKMVLVAHKTNGYWTSGQKELDTANSPMAARIPGGGDPEREQWNATADVLATALPRNDVLLFFTARDGASYLCPNVRSGTQMVLYGHAELGQLDQGGSWRGAGPLAFDPYDVHASPSAPFPVPASDWHLARRSVVVANRWPDLATEADLVPYFASRPGDAGLLNGTQDILGANPSHADPFSYHEEVGTGTVAVPPGWYSRSRLDVAPPAAQAGRLGAYLLPNCASFKVEWALSLASLPDPNGVLRAFPTAWVDPYRDPDQLGNADDKPDWVLILDKCLSAMQNAYGLNAEETVAFAAFHERVTWPQPNGRFRGSLTHAWYPEDPSSFGLTEKDPDPYFPAALRITVDVYDDTDRLERPIRHTMVISVGA
jgi:type II secretory pathway pseudopilin PulG